MTLVAKEALLSVARPRSPILTEPVGPVMKMLSHFRSRWMMGGVRVCRKWRPLRICLHQLRSTFGFITLKRFRYLQQTALLNPEFAVQTRESCSCHSGTTPTGRCSSVLKSGYLQKSKREKTPFKDFITPRHRSITGIWLQAVLMSRLSVSPFHYDTHCSSTAKWSKPDVPCVRSSHLLQLATF